VKGEQILHPPECILPLKLKIPAKSALTAASWPNSVSHLIVHLLQLSPRPFKTFKLAALLQFQKNWQPCYNLKKLAALLHFKKIGSIATI